jgi:hypothetical protein
MKFKEKASNVHGKKFDYSLVDYRNNYTKVRITCNRCTGTFLQTPTRHLTGDGCPYCANRSMNTLLFVKCAIQVHGFQFDYHKVDYKGAHTKVTLIHRKCGHQFDTKPCNHINNSSGCPKCNGGVLKTGEDFIRNAKKVHGNDRFDYSKVNYVRSNQKVIIVCCKCGGNFSQKPNSHLNGNGCPQCLEFSGERTIRLFLEENKIDYVSQYAPKGLKHRRQLKFDFYLPSYNTIIEYDGQQHFRPVLAFGGEKHFKLTKLRDGIKNKWCADNNVNLIRIPYYQDALPVLLKIGS